MSVSPLDLNLANFVTVPQLLQALTQKFGYTATKAILQATQTADTKDFQVLDYERSREPGSIEEDTLLEAIVPVESGLEFGEYNENTAEDQFEKLLQVFDYKVELDEDALEDVNLGSIPNRIELDVFDTIKLTDDDILIEPAEFQIGSDEPLSPIEELNIRPIDFDILDEDEGILELGRFKLELNEGIIPDGFVEVLDKLLEAEVELAQPFLDQLNQFFAPIGVEVLPKNEETAFDDDEIKVVALKKTFSQITDEDFPIDEFRIDLFDAEEGDDNFRIKPFGQFHLNTNKKNINFENIYNTLGLGSLPFNLQQIKEPLNLLNGNFLTKTWGPVTTTPSP